MVEEEVGKVIHYFSKVQAAVVHLTASIRIGEKLHFKGHTTDFSQTLESMQIEHKPVEKAEAGEDVGIQVKEKVRENDTVYRVIEE